MSIAALTRRLAAVEAPPPEANASGIDLLAVQPEDIPSIGGATAARRPVAAAPAAADSWQIEFDDEELPLAFPIEDYSALTAAEIVSLLPELDVDELELVREEELAGKERRTVLQKIDRRLVNYLEQAGNAPVAASPAPSGALPWYPVDRGLSPAPPISRQDGPEPTERRKPKRDSRAVAETLSEARDKIAAFIPSEALAAYFALTAVVQPQSNVSRWVVFGLTCLVIPVLAVREARVDRTARYVAPNVAIAIAVALISFTAFAATVPGTPFLMFSPPYKLGYGLAATVVLSYVLPDQAEKRLSPGR